MKRVRRLNLKKVAIFILILISIVVFAIVGIKKIIEDKSFFGRLKNKAAIPFAEEKRNNLVKENPNLFKWGF